MKKKSIGKSVIPKKTKPKKYHQTEPSENDIRCNFLSIQTEQFALFPQRIENVNEFDVRVHQNIGYNLDTSSIAIQIRFELVQNNYIVALIQSVCSYSIEPKSWANMFDNNTIVLPRDFVIHIVSLTIGAIRGIFHAKTEGTVYNGFILPPIDLITLVPSDVVLSMEKK
ncbi:MAG: hypothetical protein U0Y96_05435 [Candidatus Kapaibacterium sp.]